MDFTTINWQHMGYMALILLCSLCFLAVIALPLMSMAGQTLSLIRQRTAYAKCAKQVSLLALILGLALTLFSFWPLWQRLSPPLLALLPVDGQSIPWAELWQTVSGKAYLLAHVYAVGLLVGATVCLCVFHALWKHWKTHRVAIQCLALVAACWYGMSLFATLSIISADSAQALGMAPSNNLQKFFVPSLESTFWNGAPYVLPLAFAMAGGLSCVWLLLRRRSDDFGRDYYAQMLPWCASWARNGWLIFWLILLASTTLQWVNMAQQENYLSNPVFVQSVGYVLLWLIPGILWTLPMRSEHPLRHKVTLVLAFVFGMMSIVPIYLSI